MAEGLAGRLILRWRWAAVGEKGRRVARRAAWQEVWWLTDGGGVAERRKDVSTLAPRR